MSFAEDLTLFFSASGFADAATLAGRPVLGIFDDGASTPEVGSMYGQQLAPTFGLPAADTSPADAGATLVITEGLGAGTYTVRRVEPGEPGLAMLLLSKP